MQSHLVPGQEVFSPANLTGSQNEFQLKVSQPSLFVAVSSARSQSTSQFLGGIGKCGRKKSPVLFPFV